MVVVPAEKESPGLAVDVDVGATPESSAAVGSVHVTATAVPPRVVWTVMSLGQPEMTGGVLSMVAACQGLVAIMKIMIIITTATTNTLNYYTNYCPYLPPPPSPGSQRQNNENLWNSAHT